MKVGILHLSDIHIENGKDWIIDKAKKIAQAALGTWEKMDVIFVVISGDIANKGLKTQYSVAKEFFFNIRDYFQRESNTKVFFIAAPGNHDCDFSENTGDLKARKSFIDTVLRDSSYIERGDSIYKGCLEVQKNFFQFIRNLDPQVNYPPAPEVFYQVIINLEGRNFYFNIFNSSWLSQKNEDQGALVFPTHLINLDAIKLSDSAFSLSVFHHPDNWLESSSSLSFRRLTEKHSDIILSGHEHYPESLVKKDTEAKTETQIIKAGALQERSRPTSSTFNLIVVDLDSKRQQSFPFTWKGAEYKSGKGSGWQDFIRNRFLQSQSFYLLPNFESYINTLDSISWNTRKQTSSVQLESFFIAPRLYMTSFKNLIIGKEAVTKRIESEKFFEFLYQSKKLIIFGDTWQGKTTVAKKVYKDFYEHQYATLFVDGSKFREATEEGFRKVLAGIFPNQFDGELWDRFLQLPKEKRALVIDNFGTSNLNQESLQGILRLASEYFDLVVAFAHTDLALLQYAKTDSKDVEFSEYIHARMLPLNQTQRTQLIRSWLRFESDPSTEEDEIIRQENQLRTEIKTAVNSGVIVSTPFFIIGVLQLIESFKTNPNAQFGSIGYIYQGIITSRLAELGKTPAQINQMFLVISLVAHWFYKNDVNEIGEDDLQKVIHQYNHDYRANVLLHNLINELERAQILVRLGTHTWKFAGSHLRDFFVAKHYAQDLGEEESSQKQEAITDIRLMIETITYAPHTRILLFLVYEANSNRTLIRWILDEASKVYKETQVANFEDDVEFLNKIEQSCLDRNLLESENPRKNIDKRDTQISSNEEEDDELSITDNRKRTLVKYADADTFTKVAISLKMIELVGQLVKSFAGTIRAELKQELIEECINVGLRLSRCALEESKDKLEDLSYVLKHLIRQQHPQLTETGLEQRTDQLMLLLHHNFAYGVIKKISLSVGHEDLKDSFSDVFETKELLSYKLVETAIRLDHYNAPVADKLIKFGRDIHENKFAHHILKRLVADYVNYFEVRGPERQKLVDSFKLAGGKDYLINVDKSDREVRSSRSDPKGYLPPKNRKRK